MQQKKKKKKTEKKKKKKKKIQHKGLKKKSYYISDSRVACSFIDQYKHCKTIEIALALSYWISEARLSLMSLN